MQPSTKSLAIRLGWLAALLAVPGCVGLLSPQLPGATRGSGAWGLDSHLERPSVGGGGAGFGWLFFPLEVGNHWAYDLMFSFQVAPPGRLPGAPDVIRSTMDADLIGFEERFGREYVVQREVVHQPDPIESLYLYRQDRGGLYNADPVAVPLEGIAGDAGSAVLMRSIAARAGAVDAAYRPALLRLLDKHAVIRELALHGRVPAAPRTAAGLPGPQEGEIAMLRYPLRAGSTWHVREDPLVIYTVEGQESLALPAGSFNGWRIRIEWPEFFGPNDRVHVWYGRSGFLELAAHVESEATDENGNPLGTMVSDQTQVLTALSLVQAGTPAP